VYSWFLLVFFVLSEERTVKNYKSYVERDLACDHKDFKGALDLSTSTGSSRRILDCRLHIINSHTHLIP